jgi:CO/xanthine dehydrogenase FAD-binding subunit
MSPFANPPLTDKDCCLSIIDNQEAVQRPEWNRFREETMLQAISVPRSLAQAHAALSEAGAALVAGGTAVMPVVNLGTDAFSRLVSLRRAGLDGIAVKDGAATVGAAAPLAALEGLPDLAFLAPALDAIASPTVRNMATVGGNLFVKPPYGDFAACLVALDAAAVVSAGAKRRSVPVETLVRSGVGPGEIVVEVAFPLPADGTFRFAKAGRKALNSAAVVTVAAVVAVVDGKVDACRIGLGGVAPWPVHAPSVEKALIGKPLDRAAVEAAARLADADIEPADDAYASAWYRRRVTPVHIRRALLGA